MLVLARRALFCALAGFAILSSRAIAQVTADRAALAQLASRLLDTTALLVPSGPEPTLLPASGSPASLSEMRRGLLLLGSARAHGGREDLDAAQAAFDEAIYRAPENWPWPWYGLALADLALERGGYTVKPSMHQPAGLYYRDAAIHALGKALEADSTFAPAAKLLAERLTSTTDPAVNDEVVRAIRRSVGSSGAGPQPWLVFARMQRSLEHPDSALSAFRNYLAAGGDSAVAFIEQARSLLASGDTAAAAPMYLRGATHAGTGEGKAEYRRDIAWVASPVELEAYDSLASDSVSHWLKAFWAKRDAEELRSPNERLTEHVRRWVYVHAHFMAPQQATKVALALRMPLTSRNPSQLPDITRNFDRFAVEDLNQSLALGTKQPISPAELMQHSYLNVAAGSSEFLDDRALIYMRHGEPEGVVQSPGKPGEATPLSWGYDTPDNGRLVLSFKCTTYCLLVSWPISFDGLMALDAHYLIVSPVLIRDVQHDLAAGLATDGFPPRFEHQLAPEAQFFATGQPGRALIVFALPGEKLKALSLTGGGAGYPIALRLIATDARGRIARLDTTRHFRAEHELTKGEFLFGLEELPLSPGRWNVRLVVSENGREVGGAIGRNGLFIPGSDSLALSDLVLGREGAGLTWQSAAGPVPLNPLDAFPPNGAAELYYELHGAVPDSTYQTDIEVKGVYGDAKGTVRLTFNEKAHGSLVRTRRSIGLDKLEPGQYQVTVTVTEQGTGKTAVQSRYLNVRR
jgi:hypothetical protein